MTKAYIPNRDMPNLEGKPKDIDRAMKVLAERVAVGKFLAERPPLPSEGMQKGHDYAHLCAMQWAKVAKAPWCMSCALGEETWRRYGAGLITPIEPVEEHEPVVPVAITELDPPTEQESSTSTKEHHHE